MLSASLISRTASTSMPIACPPENAYAATSSQCDTLKRRSESANRRESTGLPYAPYSNSTACARTPSRAASSWRRRARATMNRLASRSKANRRARWRSASESSPADARTASCAAAKRVTTTSMGASVVSTSLHPLGVVTTLVRMVRAKHCGQRPAHDKWHRFIRLMRSRNGATFATVERDGGAALAQKGGAKRSAWLVYDTRTGGGGEKGVGKAGRGSWGRVFAQ